MKSAVDFVLMGGVINQVDINNGTTTNIIFMEIAQQSGRFLSS